MAIVIGIDEAGYGPNLGPLVVGASVWHVDGQADCREIARCVAPLLKLLTPGQTAASEQRASPQALLLGDSKQLYKSAGGLRSLELPVLTLSGFGTASWLAADPSQASSRQQMLLTHVDAEYHTDLAEEFWWEAMDAAWPAACSRDEARTWHQQLKAHLASATVLPLELTAAAVVPRRFNHQLQTGLNKAGVLSFTSMSLVTKLLGRFLPELEETAEPCLVLCDRHGGRRKYRSLLQEFLPADVITILSETPDASGYSWQGARSQCECWFLTGGEQHLPVAVASMLAKYLRELSMQGFNGFWQRRLPQLRPTAGYPVDASRFRREVATEQARLKIPDELFWREK